MGEMRLGRRLTEVVEWGSKLVVHPCLSSTGTLDLTAPRQPCLQPAGALQRHPCPPARLPVPGSPARVAGAAAISPYCTCQQIGSQTAGTGVLKQKPICPSGSISM